MKIIWLIIIITYIHSSELKHDFTGSLELSLQSDNKNVELNLNNDFIYKDFKFTISPSFYKNTNPIYSSVTKSDFKPVTSVYLNELYITYRLNNKVSCSIGEFPFRKGTFYEYSYNYNKAGIGILGTTDSSFQGYICSYIDGNGIYQIGDVSYRRWGSLSHYISDVEDDGTFNAYNDSGMKYFSYKRSMNKWYTEIQLMNMKQMMFQEEIISTKAGAIAISYDDSIDTGRVYYGIGIITDSNGNTATLSPFGIPVINDDVHLDEFETNGYHYLLGVTQELDKVIFNRDMSVGIEYSYRSEGFHSLLAGPPFNNYSYGDTGSFMNTFIGIRYDSNTLFKLRYERHDNEGTFIKKGFVPVERELNDERITERVMLQLYLDF